MVFVTQTVQSLNGETVFDQTSDKVAHKTSLRITAEDYDVTSL